MASFKLRLGLTRFPSCSFTCFQLCLWPYLLNRPFIHIVAVTSAYWTPWMVPGHGSYYVLTGTVDGPCYWHLPSVFRCYGTEPWLSFSALPGLDPSCCESPLLEAVCPHYGLTWIASCSWPGDKKQLLPWIHQHHVFLLLSVSEVHCFSGLDLLIQSDFATCP